MPGSLVWAEECTGPAGSGPDPGLWGQDVTAPWQRADELQSYVTSAANAHYDGEGHLVIKAIKEPTAGKPYSSAKLFTRLSAQPALFLFGLIEARIKVPTNVGVLPAFWLLGPDNEQGWPACGEIDIAEWPASALTANQVHQGTHQASRTDTTVDVPTGAAVTTNADGWGGWHTYSVDWQPDALDFYIDNRRTGTVTRASVEATGGGWVFNDSPAAIILNIAVGGWAGPPDPSWSEAAMLVDYVRVRSR
jgi:beta-glucanase (GH16 family)